MLIESTLEVDFESQREETAQDVAHRSVVAMAEAWYPVHGPRP
jgi:hypothetical protein